jgi:hypothetical protein
MSRFAALLRHRPPALATPTVNSFTASGTKQQNQAMWLGVDADNTANKYKYILEAPVGSPMSSVPIMENGVTKPVNFPYETTFAQIEIDVPAGLVGTPYFLAAAASSNNGASYSAAIPADEYFTYPSTYFIPAVLPQATLAMVSSSPVTFSVDITQYDSYIDELLITDVSGIQKYHGNVFLSSSALSSGTLALDGSLNPPPDPVMPSIAATDTIRMRERTPDFQQANHSTGTISKWSNIISPTALGGNRYWKLNFTGTSGTGVILRRIELALGAGGIQVADDRVYTTTATNPDYFFDGNDQNFTGWAAVPCSIIIDLQQTLPIRALRLQNCLGFGADPSAFTFGPCDSGGTYIGTPPVSVSGVTFTGEQLKEWTW